MNPHPETVTTLNQTLFSLCAAGDKFQVQMLLLLNIDVNCKDATGNTPLMICVKNRFCDIACVLLEKGADVNITNRQGNSALMLSVASSGSTAMAKTLLEQMTINIHQKNEEGYTCLMLAMEWGNFDIIKLILKRAFGENNPTKYEEYVSNARPIAYKKGFLNAFDFLEKEVSTHVPALISAVSGEDLVSAKFMMYFKIVKNDTCGSLIIRILQFFESKRTGVSSEIDIEAMKILLENNENVTFSCLDGKNVLVYCINIGNVILLDLLCSYLNNSHSILSKDIENIYYLALLGVFNTFRDDLLNILVKYKPYLLHCYNVDPLLETAFIYEAYQFVDNFLYLGGSIDVKKSLFFVIEHELLDSLELILTRLNTEALNIVGDCKNGVLHRAAEVGNVQIIQRLVLSGADVNSIYGAKTPLMLSKDCKVSKCLIQLGADVNKRADEDLLTPLVNLFSLEYVAYIFQQSNASIKGFQFLENISDKSLHIFSDHVKSHINLFLGEGANINDKNVNGQTALMLASTVENFHEQLKHLLESGADPNIRNNLGQTALHLSVRNKCYTNTITLLNFEADVNSKDLSGKPCLHISVEENNLRMLSLLISHGADVNIVNGDGDTALILAAKNTETNKDVIRCLLDSGADLNHQNNDGYTALMKASSCFFTEMIQIICDKGANVNLTNNGNNQNVVSIMVGKCAHIHFIAKEYFECLHSILDLGGSAGCISPHHMFKLISRRQYKLLQRLIFAGLSPSECTLIEIGYFRNIRLTNPFTTSVSPFLFALMRNRVELAEYFSEINFLTYSDIFEREKVHIIRLHLERYHCRESLEFLNQFYRKPLTLQKLCLVTISSAVGFGREREDNVNSLPLPAKFKNVLLFKQEEVVKNAMQDEINIDMESMYSEDSDDFLNYDDSDDDYY